MKRRWTGNVQRDSPTGPVGRFGGELLPKNAKRMTGMSTPMEEVEMGLRAVVSMHGHERRQGSHEENS